jgi:hypothetical protein
VHGDDLVIRDDSLPPYLCSNQAHLHPCP